MNAFICSVKSYSQVSSRDYLVASDKHFRLLFGRWFRTPPPQKKNRKWGGEKFLKKNLFQVMDLYKAGMRKLKNTTLLHNDGGLLSGLQCNTLPSLVHFVVFPLVYSAVWPFDVSSSQGTMHDSCRKMKITVHVHWYATFGNRLWIAKLQSQ